MYAGVLECQNVFQGKALVRDWNRVNVSIKTLWGPVPMFPHSPCSCTVPRTWYVVCKSGQIRSLRWDRSRDYLSKIITWWQDRSRQICILIHAHPQIFKCSDAPLNLATNRLKVWVRLKHGGSFHNRARATLWKNPTNRTSHSEQIFFLFVIGYLLYQTSRCLKRADNLTYHFNASIIFSVETTQEKKHEGCFDLHCSCFHF